MDLLFNLACYRQDSAHNGTSFDMQQLIHRFRANLIVSGLEPFEEENWSDVKIGGSVFQVRFYHMYCFKNP